MTMNNAVINYDGQVLHGAKCPVCGAKNEGNFCEKCGRTLKDGKGTIIKESIILPENEEQKIILEGRKKLIQKLGNSLSNEEKMNLNFWELLERGKKT